MHMITRLLFSLNWCPEAEYALRVENLSQFGRFLLNIIDRLSHNIGLPGQLPSVKNDVYEFLAKSFEKLLFFYCPPLMLTSRQYLSFGKFFMEKFRKLFF